MKKNQKQAIPIKQVLSSTLVAMILLMGIFIYNVAQAKNIELGQADGNEISEEEVIAQTTERTETTETTSRSEITRTETSSATQEQEKVQEQKTEETKEYAKIEDVKISKTMDLTVRTNLSKEDFKKLISTVKQDKTKFFYNNADTIYDVCEKYQINEIFFCGLISAESGWNIAANHRNKCNYISLMSNGKLLKYNSVEEGLEVAAKILHNKYLTKGGAYYYGKTLSAVKTKFCPASKTWVDLVYGRMKQII